MAMPDNANKAFRLAYDKLNENFPPENSDEFRYRIAQEFYDLTMQNGGDVLVRSLLLAVQHYLDDYAKRKAMAEYDAMMKEKKV